MAINVPKKVYSAGEQLAWMRIILPDFRCTLRNGTLVAEGGVQPTPLSATYKVRVAYRAFKPPNVWVLAPVLTLREGAKKIPHMFRQERLCLYMPDSGQWSGGMLLAKVIMPWVSLWLYYYETWHVTGEWLGGGHEPDEDKTIRHESEITYERPKR